MEALPLHILLLLFVWTVKAQVNLQDGCIKYNATTTITCTLPQGTTINNNFIFWYFGPNQIDIVAAGQVVSNNPEYGVASTGSTFSLIINELNMDDIGIYKCTYLPSTNFEYTLTKANIEDITCNATGGINEATITIQYNNKVLQKPEAAAVKSGGNPVDATCVYVSSAGEPTDGTCTFENLDPGTYSYTVTNHGICDLKCTDQVIVNESPSPGDPSGLEWWIILLIVIGIVVLLVIVIAIGIYVYIHFIKKKKAGPQADAAEDKIPTGNGVELDDKA